MERPWGQVRVALMLLRRLGRGGLAALVAVAALAVYVPVAPLFPGADVDSGWKDALNAAVARGLVFGRDLVFTYGPFGAAYSRVYHPTTDTEMLLSTALLGAAFAAGLLCLAGGWRGLLASLLLLAVLSVSERDALFFALPLLLLLLVCRGGRSWPVRASCLLLAAALGLIPLVKGTFAAASGLAVVLGVGFLLVRGRAGLALALGAVFAVSMPVFWVLVGQPLGALPGFFISQGPIVGGYTEAMSLAGPPLLPALYVGGVLLILGLHLRVRQWAGWVEAAGCAGLAFFVFKGGFVRADAHMMMAGGFIVLPAVVLGLGRGWGRGVAGAAVGLGVWATIDVSVTEQSLAAMPARMAAPFVDAGRSLRLRLGTPGALDRLYANRMTTIAFSDPLPPLSGSTDIYSYGQSVLLAHGLDWAPRPVLQSYSAYTPGLEVADASFLAERGAQNILFSVQPIDGRLGALEDGLSWPVLFSRYDIVNLRGERAVLRRRAPGAAEAPAVGEALGERRFAMGEMAALPEGVGPVWATVAVAPTSLGRLVAAAFRPPRLNIEFRFADGRTQSFRFVSGMGAAGFLISPVVTSTADFVALALPRADAFLASKRPVAFTITAESGVGSLWQSTVSVSFRAVALRSQEGVSRLLFDRTDREAAPAALPLAADCAIDLVDTRRPETLPVPLGAFMTVDGWAAVSARDGVAPDTISVTLTAPDGAVTAIRARKIARPDVNAYFGQPGMGDIGYSASADLSGLRGDYLLGLRLTKGSQAWRCGTTVPVRVGAG